MLGTASGIVERRSNTADSSVEEPHRLLGTPIRRYESMYRIRGNLPTYVWKYLIQFHPYRKNPVDHPSIAQDCFESARVSDPHRGCSGRDDPCNSVAIPLDAVCHA